MLLLLWVLVAAAAAVAAVTVVVVALATSRQHIQIDPNHQSAYSVSFQLIQCRQYEQNLKIAEK